MTFNGPSTIYNSHNLINKCNTKLLILIKHCSAGGQLAKWLLFQTTGSHLGKRKKKKWGHQLFFFMQIVAVSCSVGTNSFAFLTVKTNGALTCSGGMPTLTTAAHWGQEPELTLGSKVIRDVTRNHTVSGSWVQACGDRAAGGVG